IVLGTLSSQLFESKSESEPIDSVRRSVACLQVIRERILDIWSEGPMGPQTTRDIQAVVVVGRRKEFTGEKIRQLQNYCSLLRGIRFRTYDWLVDAALRAVVMAS